MNYSPKLWAKIIWLFLHGEEGRPIMIESEEQLDQLIEEMV